MSTLPPGFRATEKTRLNSDYQSDLHVTFMTTGRSLACCSVFNFFLDSSRVDRPPVNHQFRRISRWISVSCLSQVQDRTLRDFRHGTIVHRESLRGAWQRVTRNENSLVFHAINSRRILGVTRESHRCVSSLSSFNYLHMSTA